MENYVFYWDKLSYILESRPVLESSPFFLNFEKPVFVFLWSAFPLAHILLPFPLLFYWFMLGTAVEPYKKYVSATSDIEGVVKAFPWVCIGLAIFITFGTFGGRAYQQYEAAERTYSAAIPRTLPPRPQNAQMWIKIDAKRAMAVDAVWVPLDDLRNKQLWIKVSLVFLAAFAIVFVMSLRYFFFSLAYGSALRRRHLPTEIVNRALAGGAIDHKALANAMTPRTAPVARDSLADKIERQKLAELAARLQQDAQALNDKLSKEAQIAQLVASHALKREELAAMEQQLKQLGVKKHG